MEYVEGYYELEEEEHEDDIEDMRDFLKANSFAPTCRFSFVYVPPM